MTLIEVNPNSKTAPQDRSCEAVEFHYDDTTFHGCKTVPIAARKNVFFMVQVGEGLCIKPL